MKFSLNNGKLALTDIDVSSDGVLSSSGKAEIVFNSRNDGEGRQHRGFIPLGDTGLAVSLAVVRKVDTVAAGKSKSAKTVNGIDVATLLKTLAAAGIKIKS